VVIVPGNGCGNIRDANWYGWLYETLSARSEELGLSEVVCDNMPDPFQARASHWLPFMEEILKIDEHTIAVGHSSGSEALMRYAESNKIGVVILVSACWSDLGIKSERLSGYYPRADGTNPWRFDLMLSNCSTWHQFHSDDDPFISVEEAERVREGLALDSETNYHFLPRRSHFFDDPFPELISVIESCLLTERPSPTEPTLTTADT
jgi:uncharacterized protein